MAGLRRLSTNIAYEPRGAMQHRISLLKQHPQRDAAGEFLPMTVFSDTWAAIKLLQGRNLEKAQQISSEVTHTVVISYEPNIDSSLMVKFENRYFRIMAVVDPDERKMELHLLCLEVDEGEAGEQ